LPNRLDIHTNHEIGDAEGVLLKWDASVANSIEATAVEEQVHSGTSKVVREIGSSNTANDKLCVIPQELMDIIMDIRRHIQSGSHDSQVLDANLDKLEGFLTSQRHAHDRVRSGQSLSELHLSEVLSSIRWSLTASLALVTAQMLVLSFTAAYIANCVMLVESRFASESALPRLAVGANTS